MLERVLSTAGFLHVTGLTDPVRALEAIIERSPDLILLDLHMPDLDGMTILKKIRVELAPGEYLPVIVLTADVNPETKRLALDSGATDFLTKPFDVVEVGLRVRNVLETRHLSRMLADRNQWLEERVAERTRQLEESQREIADRLALITEFRDDITGRHTQRVGAMSAVISGRMGVDAETMDVLRIAAPLHDLGKVAIPDHILLKPGRLTPDEYEQIKMHVSVGAKILGGGASPILRMAESVALYHHERWDGTGYFGLVGEDIPLPARIVGVADVFDALCHVRTYKPAWPRERAVAEIVARRGTHFDPVVVDAFLAVEEETEIFGPR